MDKKIEFNIDVDFGVSEKERAQADKKPSNAEMVEDYINYAVTSTHPQGMDGQKRRIFGRIQRKLSDAISLKNTVLELVPAEVDLLKEAFAKAKFPAGFSKFVIILEDAINALYYEDKNTEDLEEHGS